MTIRIRRPGASPFPFALVTLVTLGNTMWAEEAARTKTKLDAISLSQEIDRAIAKQLQGEKVSPSPLADDAEFLRRVYLDITGVIPPADKAAAFLDSKDPNKRAKVVDELLASPQYGRHMADIWQSLLMPRTSDNRKIQLQPLITWLEKEFNQNKPWNQQVTELLTASGTQQANPAVTFFLANQGPDKLTDLTCKLFLGVQLQCAQCHNHPFTQWKQTEYWGMAAFYTKVKLNGNAKKAAKTGANPEVTEDGRPRQGKAAKLPESAKIVPAKFFQGEEPKLTASEPNRPVLARWLTAETNPFFARAMVNRTWHQFFGRAFVQPVDDMHDGNPASHPELLQFLAEQFAANNFDLHYLIRAICNSQTYQRTSKPFGGNDDDTTLFSHMSIKSMSAEQMYDSLTAVFGTSTKGTEGKPGKGMRKGANARDVFVTFFQTEESNPVEYQAGIPQALRLMNAPQLNTGNVAWLTQLVRSNASKPEIIERLYLTTLTRHPTPAENQRLTAYLDRHTDTRKACGDILWALLNSSEFTLNH
jgi:hypothetical protein